LRCFCFGGAETYHEDLQSKDDWQVVFPVSDSVQKEKELLKFKYSAFISYDALDNCAVTFDKINH